MIEEYHIIQDDLPMSEKLRLEFKNHFNYGDIKVKNKKYYSNFVGIIVKNDKILVSFPKNFFNKRILDDISEDISNNINNNISLLFNCIRKSAYKKSKNSIGINEELDTGYPFSSFLHIWDYYNQYGFFTNNYVVNKKGYQGKINWKETIRKSPVVYSRNNLLYLPMIINEKKTNINFISKCMVFVINNTLDTFSFIFNKKNKISLDIANINWSYVDKIVSRLRLEKESLFKDIHKRLVDNLIYYFQNYNGGGGQIKLSTKTFNLIWEDIVDHYLKYYFQRINEDGDPEFSTTPYFEPFQFQKTSFSPDRRDLEQDSNVFEIEPDHFLIDQKKRYLFDSKYYTTVDRLDYKQVAYYFLLKHHQGLVKDGEIKALATFNILFLPSNQEDLKIKKVKTHFDLNPTYNLNETSFKVKEYYLNIQLLMKYYTST